MKKVEIYSSGVVLAKVFTPQDKTKEEAVMLYCIAGSIPNRNVISAEFARILGFQIGIKYEVDVVERDPDDIFGRQFLFVNNGVWDKSVIAARNEYSQPKMVDASLNPAFTSIGNESPVLEEEIKN